MKFCFVEEAVTIEHDKRNNLVERERENNIIDARERERILCWKAELDPGMAAKKR